MLSGSLEARNSAVSNSRLLVSTSLIRNLFLFAILVSLVTGCASAGPAVYNVPPTPPAQDKARIIVNRSTDFLYLALSARVFVDGKQIGELSRGDAISTDVDPGRVTVTTDTASAPGRYSVSLNTERNAEYQFEISPRGESYGAGAAFGILGLAADASANENSGLFKIRGTGLKKYGATAPSSPVTAAPKQQPITSVEPPPPSAIPITSSAKERLQELKKLLDDGLINQEDYDQKKRQILKDI